MCLFTELGKFSQLIIGKNRVKSKAVYPGIRPELFWLIVYTYLAGKVKEKKQQENEK